MNAGLIVSLAAVMPMAAGPFPQEQRSLVAGLCNGEQIVIPIGDDEQEPGRDCHQKACHAGTCREKAKRAGTV